jgi:Plavaka transposase
MLPASTWGSIPIPNVFNLLRLYYRRTAINHDPESKVGFAQDDLQDAHPRPAVVHSNPVSPPVEILSTIGSSSTPAQVHSLAPFSNLTSFKLAEWFWASGSRKSLKDFRLLVDIISDPSFSIADVADANWAKLFSELSSPGNKTAIRGAPEIGGCEDSDDDEWQDSDRWIETPLKIEVPFHRQMKNSGVDIHLAGTLHHRSILAILEQVISQPQDFHSLHFHPFRRMWKPNVSAPPVSVYDELYTSDSFIQADRELQDSSPNPSDSPGTERVIIALMFWSDKTQLAPFGGAELWPLYMFIGNQSKWRRCKGSSNTCHHVAFFESVRPLSLSPVVHVAYSRCGSFPPTSTNI